MSKLFNPFKACMDCVDRTPGCQDRCEKYQAGKAEWLEYKAKLRYGRNADRYTFDQIEKHRNKRAIKRRDYHWRGR